LVFLIGQVYDLNPGIGGVDPERGFSRLIRDTLNVGDAAVKRLLRRVVGIVIKIVLRE
jgi:hypothetical protein